MIQCVETRDFLIHEFRGFFNFFRYLLFLPTLFFVLDDIICIGTNKERRACRDYLWLKGSVVTGCVFWVEALLD